MTPSSIPIPKLALFGRAKLQEFRRDVARISAYSFEHILFLGGLAGMAYGAWMIWHPLGPILGGWFGVRVAKLIAEERR